jgi:rhamnogalacturonyl hydrolase YesR
MAVAVLGIVAGSGAPLWAQGRGATGPLGSEQIRATIRRVADWQLAHPAPYSPQHWAMAPLYEGLIDASLATGDPAYLAAVIRAGRRIAWRPGPDVYHADDHAAGNAWLRLYLMDPSDPAVLASFRTRFNEILAKPIREPLSFTTTPRTRGVDRTDRWTWSDALYMAPPTLARLAQATGDERYLEFAEAEFRATWTALFDREDKLLYRDARFIGQRTPNGAKVFWSRGNGWVYAGLAEVLGTLPREYPGRRFYSEVFRQMSPAVLATQQPDGLWYPSLKDPKQVPIGETSGSALLLFGLAFGVREGLLDSAAYWPAVERGWRGLETRIAKDGAVNFVQPIGAAPETFPPDSREPYGTGAVLTAGAEILHALGQAANVDSAVLLQRARSLVASSPDLSRFGPEPRPAGGADDRAYSVQVLTRIARPVLEALSNEQLKQRLPIHEWERARAAWTHYEAFARTLAGIAPWLELGPDETAEGRLRAEFIRLARRSLINATNPASPDFLNFGQVPDQPLVESAYLAYALMRAPRQLWEPLTTTEREQVLNALRLSRTIDQDHNNNWHLFPAMIEAALWQLANDSTRIDRIDTAVVKFEQWYLGDGVYGDGPDFHWDYYNSYVIHPMLLQVLRVAAAKGHRPGRYLARAQQRAHRYAEVLERLISPEGTFPVMGRSSAYRFAVFFHLGDLAVMQQLPPGMNLGALRAGITTVVRRMVEAPGTFDQAGWLTLGAVGEQPGLQETYNATGSLYVCLTGLVHLGLPADDPFWTAAPAAWTQRRIWAGENVARDRALRGH